MNWIINVAIYQLVWFLSVLGRDRYLLIAGLLLGLHFAFSAKRRSDFKLVAMILAIGLIVDGTLKASGFFSFSDDSFPIPFWLMAIWIALGTLPHHSLSWLKNRYGLCAAFGTIGGPLAYWAGVRFGAATFELTLMPSILVLAAIWGLVFPLIMYLSRSCEVR